MNIALVLSGGTGTRLGADIPKQYIEVNNKMIISYCLETLLCHEEIDAIQIVAEASWQQMIVSGMEALLEETGVQGLWEQKFRGFSVPGKNRQCSILNGLTDIQNYATDTDNVLVHDAARPCLSDGLISACFAAMVDYDGVLPVLPMKDTVYISEDGAAVKSLLDRKQIFAGQAPECFVLRKYYEANVALLPEMILQVNGSTEPAIMAEMRIKMIPGEETNFKITTVADLGRFEEIVRRKAD